MPELKNLIPRLPVADLSRTIDFYTRSLGFVEDILWPEDAPTFVILKRDDVQLGFFTSDRHRVVTHTGQAELYLEVEDVQGIYETIKNRVDIEWGPEVYFYGRREFALRDPDGYLIIFTEPTNDPPTSPEN